MFSKKKVFGLFIIVLNLCRLGLAVEASSYDPQISKNIDKLNLLFPLVYEHIENRMIEYKLKAYNGCYSWDSSQPSYLSVSPINTESRCGTEVIVRSKANKPFDNVIWITAKDWESGDILKVEAKIAQIERIEILTKLRSIDVGDVQVLEVLGYDHEGNVFSTLEGVKFEWTIEQDDSVLEFVSFKDSLIKISEIRTNIENRNFQTDIIVVKGLKTGKIKVNAKVNEKSYSVVKASVSLVVIEKFILYPEHETFILPTTQVRFEIALVKTEHHLITLQRIKVPNDNYNWLNSNSEIGNVWGSGVFQSLNLIGMTSVSVQDTRINNNTVSCKVYVVEPTMVELQIKEYTGEDDWEKLEINLNYYSPRRKENFENNWNLIRNKQYYVRASIFDENKNRITLTDDNKFRLIFDQETILVEKSKPYEWIIKPIKRTEYTKLGAVFEEIVSYDPSLEYKLPKKYLVEKKVSVYSVLTVISPASSIHLPFVPEGGNSTSSQFLNTEQFFTVKVLGGSGYYEFLSSNTSIFSINTEGVIKAKGLGIGALIVKDRKNNKNKDQIDVEITVPGRLELVEACKEIEVSKNSTLGVIALGGMKSNRKYSNCSSLSFDISSRDSNIHNIITSPIFEEYDSLLKDINTKINENEHFSKALEKYQSAILDNSFYYDYLETGEITEPKLREIFNVYSNYGICSRVGIASGSQRIDIIGNAILLNDMNSKLSSEEVRIRVYDNYKTEEPIISSVIFQEPEVMLTYGSSFQWILSGGPSLWESSRKFIDNHTVFEDSDRMNPLGYHNIHFESLPTTSTIKNRRVYNITCLFPSVASNSVQDISYFVEISSENDADFRLPYPERFKASIKISCKIPRQIQIYLLKDENEFSLGVNEAKVFNYENLFLKNNETYRFQIYAFDVFNRPFYNLSTMEIAWGVESSSPHYLDEVDRSSVCPFCNDHFRELTIGAFIGTIKIKVKSEGYEESITKSYLSRFQTLTDELVLTIVKNPVALPSYNLVFLHPDNTVKVYVQYGSGTFRVTLNDTSAMRMVYNEGEISLSPLKLGNVILKVEDTLMEKAQPIFVNVDISRARHVSLKSSQTLLQEQATSEFEVQVYPKNREDVPSFPQSQYRFMNISLDLDTSDESLILKKESTYKIARRENKNNIFDITFLRAGYFKLSAKVSNTVNGEINKLILESNPVEVHVYKKLEAHPAELLLAPGCVTNIELRGGPSEKSMIVKNIELKTFIPSHGIVTFERQKSHRIMYGVEAKNIGETTLNFDLVHLESSQIIASLVVKTKVALVNHMEISGFSDAEIHMGASVRMIAMTKFNNMVFSPGVCSFSFIWKSSNDDVLKVYSPNIKQMYKSSTGGVSPMEYDNYHVGVNATAINIGLVQIKLSAVFHYPKGFATQEISAQISLSVIPSLDLLLPSYIRKDIVRSTLLLLPPGSMYKLENPLNHEKVRYSISLNDKESQIKLDDQGLIEVEPESQGSAVVFIERQKRDKDLIILGLQVRKINSIFVENSHMLLTLPVEGRSNLEIHLLDSYGRLFPRKLKGAGDVGIHLTNPKVVEIQLDQETKTVSIQGKSKGTTMCQVYLLSNPNIHDIFLIIVDSIVSPASPVYVHEGGMVKFSVISDGGAQLGRWLTEDKDVIRIEEKSGKCNALKEGKATVLYKDTIQYSTKLVVFKVNKIVLDYNAPRRMTNIPSLPEYKELYKIGFRLLSGEAEVKSLADENSNINNNLKFICETESSDWFYVTHEIETTGDGQKPYCILRTKKNYPVGSRVPSFATLTVWIVSDNDGGFKFNQNFNFEFIWAFKIADKSLVELNFADNSKVLEIQSPYELEVRCDNKKLRSALKAKFNPEKNLMYINITWPLLSEYQQLTEGNIFLENILNNQTEVISVKYDPVRARSSSSWNWILKDYTFVDGMIITILLGTLTIAILYFGNGNNQQQQKGQMMYQGGQNNKY